MPKFTYTIRKDGRLTKTLTVNGKKYYLYSNNPEDLKRQYIELQNKSYIGNINIENVKIKDFTEKWLNLNSTGKEISTINEYRFLIDSYIIPKFGTRKIKDIKIYDIKELMKEMESIPTTAKKVLQLIKRILNDAVDNDIIVKNVAQNIKPPKIIKGEKIPLTLEEDKLLLNSNSKYSIFFILMRYTGMRREEIVPLTINDVDFTTNEIIINKAVTFIHNQPVLKTTKNTKTRRVPILNIINDLVTNLVENAKQNNRELLFVKESDSKMLTESAIKRHLESFLYTINKANNTNFKFTCHQLRHSYCTMLYYADVKIKKTQELMGHSSADMVYDIYTHLDEKRENANELINNYINRIMI